MTDTRITNPTILTDGTLVEIGARGIVTVPSYDRSTLTAGIVHFGVGGFHRAHQAMIIDDLLTAGGATDFAICGVGVLEQDRRMKTVMDAQDCLYTLVSSAASSSTFSPSMTLMRWWRSSPPPAPGSFLSQLPRAGTTSTR